VSVTINCVCSFLHLLFYILGRDTVQSDKHQFSDKPFSRGHSQSLFSDTFSVLNLKILFFTSFLPFLLVLCQLVNQSLPLLQGTTTTIRRLQRLQLARSQSLVLYEHFRVPCFLGGLCFAVACGRMLLRNVSKLLAFHTSQQTGQQSHGQRRENVER
jgi:hypothetical protein